MSIIKIDIKDTQCGAKIFTLEAANELFKNEFQSRWLFDVELFIRLKAWKTAQNKAYSILEYPLKKWIHKDGSKLGLKDSFKIFFELNRIKNHYGKLANSTSAEVHTKQNSPANVRLHNYHQPTEAS